MMFDDDVYSTWKLLFFTQSNVSSLRSFSFEKGKGQIAIVQILVVFKIEFSKNSANGIIHFGDV